jgi:protein SCO1/2
MLARYLESFDARITAITGTPKQIETILKNYKAYAKKVPIEGGTYTMDHTASVFLMDAQGRFAGTLDHHEANDVKLKKLRLLLAKPL